jgi:lipoyl(octanoyl) transferase
MHTPGTTTLRRCEVHWLGTVPYEHTLELQAELVRERAAGRITDRLLLLEHPHVLTLGRDSHPEHVVVDRARLQALGVEIHAAGRGGDVTYHGPGQLVAYPILDLAPDRCDLHRYVRDLERALIATLAEYGIAAHAVPGRTGAWVHRDGRPDAKVAAIGVRVARWITSHGIALNVHTDLRYFDLIVPCGLRDSGVTSMAELLGGADGAPGELPNTRGRDRAPTVAEVGQRFAASFAAVFERELVTP